MLRGARGDRTFLPFDNLIGIDIHNHQIDIVMDPVSDWRPPNNKTPEEGREPTSQRGKDWSLAKRRIKEKSFHTINSRE